KLRSPAGSPPRNNHSREGHSVVSVIVVAIALLIGGAGRSITSTIATTITVADAHCPSPGALRRSPSIKYNTIAARPMNTHTSAQGLAYRRPPTVALR